jgi:cold shock CspA family protein
MLMISRCYPDKYGTDRPVLIRLSRCYFPALCLAGPGLYNGRGIINRRYSAGDFTFVADHTGGEDVFAHISAIIVQSLKVAEESRGMRCAGENGPETENVQT